MLPKDETQHQAELRQAFLKHLPRRIELLQKRAQRLANGPWDINLLGVLCQETQVLTGATGRYGLIEANERLYQLELLLTDLLCDAAVPEPSTRLRLTDLSARLLASPETPRATEASVAEFVVEPGQTGTAAQPDRLAPPESFWQLYVRQEMTALSTRHALGSSTPPTPLQIQAASPAEPEVADPLAESLRIGGNAEPLPHIDPFDDAPSFQTLAPPDHPRSVPVTGPAAAPDVAAPARLDAALAPATPRAYVLAEPSPMARELSDRLLTLGMTVERFDQIEELKETLATLAADLVVIDAGFAAELEQLGEFLRRIRQRVNQRIAVCALLPGNDLQQRLRAMRAGVDLVLSLPLTAADVAQRARELVLGAEAADFRILIVEDDRSQALFAESVLRKAGMSTCVVGDPLETLANLDQFRPDLILMDLYMPGIDGLELTAIIRERDEFISTPIVFLSGEQDSDKHFEALSAGGDDFLAKPIRPRHLISAVTNRARRARALRQRKQVATPRDAESGLYERTWLLDRLGAQFGQEQPRCSLAFVELDGAARLREQHGAAGIDALLAQMAGAIVGSLGSGEAAARYGDASVLVLAPGRSGAALVQLAEQWRAQISAGLYELEGKVVPLQISAGVAELTPAMGDPATLITAAERAMLLARQPSSRERVRLYMPERPRSDADALLDTLRLALQQDGFQLLFQPIVALSSTGQEQYEVLVRVRCEDGSLLPASQFMAQAVQHQLASEIDRQVLGKCFAILDERRRQGRKVRLFIGQSSAALEDAARAAWIRQMLDTRKLPADHLVLMFDYNELLPKLRAALPQFQALRNIGVKLGLDAFESSLTALQLLGYLPADYLRLAGRYIGSHGVAASEELRAMVSAAHDGGRQVLASRVENAQTAASLWSLGVDLIQGNFVQQPGADLGFDFNTSAL